MTINNPKFFGQSTTGTPNPIEDGVDFPHTGLLRALSTASSGRIPLTGFNIVSPTTTSIPVSAGTILYDGRVATVVLATLTLDTTYTNGYHLLVVTKPTGDPLTGTLALRNPTAVDKVPAYTAGDTIIAVITHTGSAPLIQYLTYDKVSNHVSLAYDNLGTPPIYTEVGTIKASGSGVDLNVTAGNLTFKNAADNLDIIFKGTDAGAEITALTLNMSDAGKALFSAGANFIGDVDAAGRTLTQNTIANNGNNRILTATTTAYNHNAEANLTFDGTTLANTNGGITATNTISANILTSTTTITAGGIINANGGIQSNKYYATAYEVLDINWPAPPHAAHPTGEYSYVFIGDISSNPVHAPTGLLSISLPLAATTVGRLLTFKNLNAANIAILAQSAENIDSTATAPIPPTTGSTTLTPAAGPNATYITLAPLQTITLMSVGGEGALVPPFVAGYYIMGAMS
tara:strand:- start:1208 stop:2587 length:1380 start_codon:yes stop_codon:yes gene_type:complete